MRTAIILILCIGLLGLGNDQAWTQQAEWDTNGLWVVTGKELRGQGGAAMLRGSEALENFCMTGELRIEEFAKSGAQRILLRFRQEKMNETMREYLVRFEPDTIALQKNCHAPNDKFECKILQGVKQQVQTRKWFRFRIVAIKDALQIEIGMPKKLILKSRDSDPILRGGFGLYVFAGTDATFRKIEVTPLDATGKPILAQKPKNDAKPTPPKPNPPPPTPVRSKQTP